MYLHSVATVVESVWDLLEIEHIFALSDYYSSVTQDKVDARQKLCCANLDS